MELPTDQVQVVRVQEMEEEMEAEPGPAQEVVPEMAPEAVTAMEQDFILILAVVLCDHAHALKKAHRKPER
jgi:hypothetical protein